MKITVNITCGENRNTRGANLKKTIITMQLMIYLNYFIH